MAKLYISVFAEAGFAFLGKPIHEEAITVGAGSAASQAIPGGTNVQRWVRIAADVECQVAFGANPTADGDSEYWPYGHVEGRYLDAGDKIAVIQKQ